MVAQKRVAIIHDSYLHFGGAEVVLHRFIKKFPNADVYIPLLLEKYHERLRLLSKGKIVKSTLSKLPFLNKYASILKPLVIFYFETLDLSDYDLVISSSHSFSSKSVNRSRNARHISYIHTPPKYLYSEFNEMGWIKKLPFKILLWPIIYVLRKYDYYASKKPDLLIANSINVQKRIKKYYHRTSIVIYPPHNTSPQGFVKKQGKHFLFFSRLEKQKGAELVVKTCSQYNLPLVVVGDGSQKKYLKKIAGPTVQFRGFVSEKEKISILAETKALLYAAIDEDYGMVIPEVISYGIPVIAYKSGAINEIAKGMQSKNQLLLFETYNQQSLFHATSKIN